LGDRELRKGCIGTDVKVLATLLSKRWFLNIKDLKTNDAGYAIYDEVVEEGVRNFQKTLKSIYKETGIADLKTIEGIKDFCK
jgi:hypothetical protein